jgi:S-adenosylmethionine/arginine decarboxylase-like enzyme
MDAYVHDEKSFYVENLTLLFHELVGALGMKMLREPEFVEVPIDREKFEYSKLTGDFKDSGGTTGFALISTSHLSMHCWPLEKFISIDVFSCKPFDADQAVHIIERILNVSRAEKIIIQRKKPA